VFLKASHLVRRRALAKELCDEGAVALNGHPARPGKEVAPGDRLRVRLWNKVLEIEVTGIPEPKGRGAAGVEPYVLLSETRIQEGES